MPDDAKLELGAPAAPAAPTPSAPATPAVPDRYAGKTTEELIAMHREAETKIGQMGTELGQLRKPTGTQPAAPATPNDGTRLAIGTPAPAPQTPQVIGSSMEALAKANLDPDEVIAHYTQTGKLADTHLSALEKIGIGAGLATSMAAGEAQKITAALAAEQKDVENTFGADGYKTILSDASSLITSDHLREQFNRDLNTPGKRLTTIKALNDLRLQALGAKGSNPTFKGSAPGSNGGPITKGEEIVATHEAARKGDPVARTRIMNTDTKPLHMDMLKRPAVI